MWRGKENRGLGLIVVFQYQQYYSHNNNIFRINKPIATLMSKVFACPPMAEEKSDYLHNLYPGLNNAMFARKRFKRKGGKLTNVSLGMYV